MQDQLHKIRHTASHVLAQAVLELYPDAKLAIGPAIDDGFYYDFDLNGQTFSEDTLKELEKMMRKIIGQNQTMVQSTKSVAETRQYFKEKNQPYKVELIDDLEKAGETQFGFYDLVNQEGNSKFIDLCKGPHVTSTKEIGAVKLLKVAGAYWRGSEKNPMLQRIYGTAFATQQELTDYLAMLEEAKKRDHRKIGQDQELFFFDEMVGKGLVLWLPNGTIIRDEIERLAVEFEREAGYQRVVTPHLAKEELFLTSGHLPYYKDGMYPAMIMDDGTYYLKAMNCPHHHRIYGHGLRSYRDLPLRLAEYGTVYRNELSGTLAGLLRVRALAMNDAHIYCRKDQVKDEFKRVIELTMCYFKLFNLDNFWFRLSKWSPDHADKYINEPENWKYTEQVLREVLQEMEVTFVEADDEAAFYGPKVDIQFKSVIGREETMSTVQLDFVAKTRFGLHYTDETGKPNNDVFVIHRAPLSTHERFMAFLIEHYAGIWPVWLAPVQVIVAPVGEQFNEQARALSDQIKQAGIRVELDDSNESVGKKVRAAEQKKVPYTLVVGQKEIDSGELTVRLRGSRDMVTTAIADFIKQVQAQVTSRKD